MRSPSERATPALVDFGVDTMQIDTMLGDLMSTDTSEDCPPGPFETDPNKIVPVSDQQAFHSQDRGEHGQALPVEIVRLRSGAVSFTQTDTLSSGRQTWYALDIDRQHFIAVLTVRPGTTMPAIRPEKLSPYQQLRSTTTAGYERSEFVTIARASPEQIRQFACLANTLLADDATEPGLPMPMDMVKKEFTLYYLGKAQFPPQINTNKIIQNEIETFIYRPLQQLVTSVYD